MKYIRPQPDKLLGIVENWQVGNGWKSGDLGPQGNRRVDRELQLRSRMTEDRGLRGNGGVDEKL